MNDDTKIQGGCALFSLKRYREGFEAAFTDVPGGEYQQSEPPFQGMMNDKIETEKELSTFLLFRQSNAILR